MPAIRNSRAVEDKHINKRRNMYAGKTGLMPGRKDKAQ